MVDNLQYASEIRSSPLQNAEHVRDLIWFDGPLLSEYRLEDGTSYLAYWCDTDGEVNRWMYLPVSDTDIDRLGPVPTDLDQIVLSRLAQAFVILQDIASDGRTLKCYLCEASRLPESYGPK